MRAYSNRFSNENLLEIRLPRATFGRFSDGIHSNKSRNLIIGKLLSLLEISLENPSEMANTVGKWIASLRISYLCIEGDKWEYSLFGIWHPMVG